MFELHCCKLLSFVCCVRVSFSAFWWQVIKWSLVVHMGHNICLRIAHLKLVFLDCFIMVEYIEFGINDGCVEFVYVFSVVSGVPQSVVWFCPCLKKIEDIASLAFIALKFLLGSLVGIWVSCDTLTSCLAWHTSSCFGDASAWFQYFCCFYNPLFV